GTSGFSFVLRQAATPTSMKIAPSMDRNFMAPPCFNGISRLCMFLCLFFKCFPIEHFPLRTALDNPARGGCQLRFDLSIEFCFLRQLGCEYPLDSLKPPPLFPLHRDQRTFLDRLENDVREMADFVFAQHTTPVKSNT